MSEHGRTADAVGLSRRGLAIRERHPGPERLEVAASLNNLAGLHALLRQHTEAATLYLRALALQEQALGPDDAVTVATVRNLAAVYVAQEGTGAPPLIARLVNARERALGAGDR